MTLFLHGNFVIMKNFDILSALFAGFDNLANHLLLYASLALQARVSDKSLDFWSFVFLAIFAKSASNDELLDIVTLFQRKQFADTRCPFRTETTLFLITSKTVDVSVTLLNNDEIHD